MLARAIWHFMKRTVNPVTLNRTQLRFCPHAFFRVIVPVRYGKSTHESIIHQTPKCVAREGNTRGNQRAI